VLDLDFGALGGGTAEDGQVSVTQFEVRESTGLE
jgi:hypothetical protein